MNIDIVIGSAAEARGLDSRHRIGPNPILSLSPLAVVDEIQRKIKPPAKIKQLRIFLAKSESQFPSSQLARLGGLFTADGSVEIFVPAPGGTGGSRTAGSLGTAGFQGSGFGGFNLAGQSNIGGGLGFGGGFGGGSLSGNIQHLSGLLKVPVKLSPL